MKFKPDCNMYENSKLPPCTSFLNNTNPLIKDGKLIYRNNNRLFYYIGTAPRNSNLDIGSCSVTTNIQIGLSTYIIGLFLTQLQIGDIKYSKNIKIHNNSKINSFIHNTLNNPPNLEGFDNIITNLALVYSNGNAILDPLNYTLIISKLNYFILFVISRIENNPGLYFINNSFATEDCLNFFLASKNIKFPFFNEDLFN